MDDWKAYLPTPWFWKIIEDVDCDSERLTKVLNSMSKEDMIRFHNAFVPAVDEVLGERFRPYFGDSSEDGLSDIGYWIVSQGEEYYSSILANPPEFPTDSEPEPSEYLFGETHKVFYERFGENIVEYQV